MSKRFLLLVAAMILCMSVFVGCSGDDGKDGVVDQATLDKIAELEATINGDPNSPEVPGLLEQIEQLKQQLAAQAGANIVKEETCSTCHAVYDLHHDKYVTTTLGLVDFKNNWDGKITNVVVDTGANTATITFSATNAGSALTTLDADATGGTKTVKIFYYNPTTKRWSLIVNLSNQTFAHTSGGVYTVTVTDSDLTTATLANPLLVTVLAARSGAGTATQDGAPVTTLGNLKDGFNTVKILSGGTLSDFNSPANPRNYVSDEGDDPSCARCHGKGEFNYHHNNTMRATADQCFACHNGRSNELGGAFNPGTGLTSNSALVVRVHGVHAAGALETGYLGAEFHLPTSVSDCALCHTTPAQQALIASEDNFKLEVCVTCHGAATGANPFESMTFGHTAAYQYESHKNNISYDSVTSKYVGSYSDCTLCHGDGAGWEFVRTNLHKYFDSKTDAGVYTYTDLNKSWKYEYVIDSIAVSGRNVTVNWYVQAKDGGAKLDVLAANPEFAFIRTGSYAPGFTVGYATGDDWTNEGVGNINAQPQSVSFSASNVIPVGGNVFKTTFAIPAGVDTTIAGRKGIVALRGIPTTTTKPNPTGTGNTAYAYVDTVTREFNLTDGALPATPRRVTATFEGQCKSCHDHLVGHGHSYVNNIDVCMICHNPSATDKGSRLALVPSYNASNSADGKDEESFDFRYMLHRIHSVGANDNAPYFIYRTRGIYGFYADAADAAAFPAHVNNKVQIHYPRAVTACGACHDFTQGFHGTASLQAAPLTLKQNDDLTTETDDTVISPNAGACISCHPANQGHAATQSYYVTLIKNIFTKLSIVNK